MPELTKLLRTKSIMRYLPPNGTAGLLLTSVKGRRRSPFPPAMIIPKIRRGFIDGFLTVIPSYGGWERISGEPPHDSKRTLDA